MEGMEELPFPQNHFPVMAFVLASLEHIRTSLTGGWQ